MCSLKSMAIPVLAQRRLQSDYLQLLTQPVDNVWAHPIEDNILEWHYVFRGPEGTPFEGGLYLGRLLFPYEYPLKPPSIYMITPNGKFRPNVRICVAGISDLHPEHWSALQTVTSILISLYSFMIDKIDAFAGKDANTMSLPRDQRTARTKELAQNSHAFNARNQMFCKLFPDLVQQTNQRNN